MNPGAKLISRDNDQGDGPGWHLNAVLLEIVVDSAPCRLDLGAIAKGFTLDRMAAEADALSTAWIEHGMGSDHRLLRALRLGEGSRLG